MSFDEPQRKKRVRFTFDGPGEPIEEFLQHEARYGINYEPVKVIDPETGKEGVLYLPKL